MTDDELVQRIDGARSCCLCAAGSAGWRAVVTIGPDGVEHLALIHQDAIGREHYDAAATTAAHEQTGRLPAEYAERVGLVCGAPARTQNGRPCRNRVTTQGERCQWHKAGQ